MTVTELIDIYDEDNTNDYDFKQKMRWLKNLDRQILSEVVLTHFIPREIRADFEPEYYFSDWGENKELLIPEERAEVYINYINLRGAQAMLDNVRIRAAGELFNTSYIEYAHWYNRTHQPLSARLHMVDHRGL